MDTDQPQPDAVVELRQVVRSYPHPTRPVHALRGVDLSVARGEFVAVMGASGSGKSTLLHLIGGLDRPSAGTVLVGGADLGTLSDRQLTLFRRRRVGVVFQAFNLVPTLTAQENVALPMVIDGAPRAQQQARSAELLDRVGLADRADHRPDGLSGGEQQRVAIARALLMQPEILLADEPTGNLDSANAEAIWTLLGSLGRQLGTTVLVVTHEPAVAAPADRVVVIRDGRIVGEILTRDCGHDPSLVATRCAQLAR